MFWANIYKCIEISKWKIDFLRFLTEKKFSGRNWRKIANLNFFWSNLA